MQLTAPHVLDIPATYASHDPSDMGARLLSLPNQARDGWRLGERFEKAPDPIRSVLIAGMGGSAIGGEMIRGLADLNRGNAQITPWRDYGLPGWVDDQCLVAAVSVSGKTIECRSAFAAAAVVGVWLDPTAIAAGSASRFRPDSAERVSARRFHVMRSPRHRGGRSQSVRLRCVDCVVAIAQRDGPIGLPARAGS